MLELRSWLGQSRAPEGAGDESPEAERTATGHLRGMVGGVLAACALLALARCGPGRRPDRPRDPRLPRRLRRHHGRGHRRDPGPRHGERLRRHGLRRPGRLHLREPRAIRRRRLPRRRRRRPSRGFSGERAARLRPGRPRLPRHRLDGRRRAGLRLLRRARRRAAGRHRGRPTDRGLRRPGAPGHTRSAADARPHRPVVHVERPPDRRGPHRRPVARARRPRR